MMEIEQVSKMLDFSLDMTRVIARENFNTFIVRERDGSRSKFRRFYAYIDISSSDNRKKS
jgi:hypothetical protein